MSEYTPIQENVGPPVPPGTEIDPRSTDQLALFEDLISSLGLIARGGVLTPWATRESDLAWTELSSLPNIAIFSLSSMDLRRAMKHTHGSPVPFIAIVAQARNRLPTVVEAERAFDGSAYELFETQAVYAQEDARNPPGIAIVYWGRRREPEDPDRGNRGLESIARMLGGFSAYAVQLPIETSRRRPPSLPFDHVLRMQLAAGEYGHHRREPREAPIGDAAPVSPAPSPPPAPTSVSFVTLFAVGIGSVATGFALKKMFGRKS